MQHVPKPRSERDLQRDPVAFLYEMEQWGNWKDDQLKGLIR
jgi:hypothetical protein